MVLHQTLSRLAPVTQELLDSRQLLRRADTKFLAAPSAIAEIIGQVATDYAVVAVGAANVASYQNVYFDTRDVRCFHDHRRGRRIRHKIRIRRYVDRQLAFLEVKARRNDLHTDKARMRIDFATRELEPPMLDFLVARCGFAREIMPIVNIDYERIMLVGVATNERITIDLGVTVNGDRGLAIGAVAIVEVKQPSRSLATPIMRALREHAIRPCSVSKYMAALTSTTSLRSNRLRPASRRLEKIANP